MWQDEVGVTESATGTLSKSTSTVAGDWSSRARTVLEPSGSFEFKFKTTSTGTKMIGIMSNTKTQGMGYIDMQCALYFNKDAIYMGTFAADGKQWPALASKFQYGDNGSGYCTSCEYAIRRDATNKIMYYRDGVLMAECPTKVSGAVYVDARFHDQNAQFLDMSWTIFHAATTAPASPTASDVMWQDEVGVTESATGTLSKSTSTVAGDWSSRARTVLEPSGSFEFKFKTTSTGTKMIGIMSNTKTQGMGYIDMQCALYFNKDAIYMDHFAA